MAQTKKTSTGKSRSASAKKTQKAPETAPHRREVGAFICLLLAIFTFLGFGSTDGKIINLFSDLIKGLFGWGFYVLPFALLIASAILMFHRGRPVTARLISALALPVVFGGLYQLFGTKTEYAVEASMFRRLWIDGGQCTCGGIFAGGLAALFRDWFTKAGAAILFICLGVFLLLVILNQTVESLLRRYKERTPYTPQPKQEKPVPVPAAAPVRPSQTEKPANRQTRPPVIDIPLDGDAPAVTGEKSGKHSYFNRKPRVTTPDEFIAGNSEIPAPADDVPENVLLTRDYLDRKHGAAAPVPIREPEITPAEETIPPEAENAPADAPDPVPEIVVSEPVPAPVPAPEPLPEVVPHVPKGKEPIPQLEVREPAEGENPPYVFPPLSLLSGGSGEPQGDSSEEIRVNKERLENALRSFGVNAAISNIIRGPSVTRYEMELEVGVKLNKLTNLSDDIALALGASGVRIAAIPNKISTVGIEVPNKLISKVYLREIIDSQEFRSSSSKLTFAIGKNISGEAIVGNIAKLPHLLVAGTTGSGKSVCLNSLILSIMYKATPDEVKFILIDPKMVEFKIYNGIPQLLVPVVTEAKKAAGALQWAVVEMMKRYRLFSETGARDIQSYNAIAEKDEELKAIPRIVVVIDELADLMMVAAKEVEESICRVAQMGRAAGVHLIIATQSPRADVITGLMKANIPSRIALKVSSSLESRIILDAGGAADKLVGYGDMLFAPIGTSKPARIQGTWVSDEEREGIIDFVKRSGTVEYAEDVIDQINRAAEDKKQNAAQEAPEEHADEGDDLLPQAVSVILETGQASVSMLQRRLKLGYARAARIVDQMEERGIVGPFEGSKPRQILITKEQWAEMQFVQGTAPIEKAPEDEQQNMFSAEDLFPGEEK